MVASFAAMTFVTMLAYSIFTIQTTAWRTKFRRQANNADNQAANVALDSLIIMKVSKFSIMNYIKHQNMIKH